jgi:hypothetical protein
VKVPLGGGAYLEPDEGSRETLFHMRILAVEPIPNTQTGNYIKLECGHRVMAFGRLQHAAGRILCTVCRDGAN